MKTIYFFFILLINLVLFSCQKKTDSTANINIATDSIATKRTTPPTEEVEEEKKQEKEEVKVYTPKTYFINDASEQYSVIITKDSIIQIISNIENFEQTFISEEFSTFGDSTLVIGHDSILLIEEKYAVMFDDFNFDWSEDVAIKNGNYGAYGGPTYDVYVYNVTRNKFVLSEELSALTYQNLGMFECNQEKEVITTFNKSGCCWHSEKDYAVIPNKGLQLVRETSIDAQGLDSVITTTKKLIDGEWITETSTSPMEKEE